MIYPNLQVIDSSSNVYFSNENQEGISTKAHQYISILLKKNDSEVGVVFMSQPIENITGVINYVTGKNYPHVIFIIDDVFRESIFRVISSDTNYGLFNRDFSNLEVAELDIVQDIIKECKIKSFKVYHCEKLRKQDLNKRYNFNVNYLDIFLSNFVYSNPNWKCCSSITKSFDKKISILSNRFDYHRALMIGLLLDEEEVLYTFNDTKAPTSDTSVLGGIIEELENPYKELLTQNIPRLDKKFENKIVLPSHEQHNCFGYDMIKRSFLHIIAETTYMSPFPYISEKSLKPMMICRPFIMLGPVNNLKMLKSLGFRTFNKWWDESYDQESDNSKRLIKVYEVVKSILDKPYEELKTMLDEMIPVLDFNRKHIKNIPEYFYNKFISDIKNTY